MNRQPELVEHTYECPLSIIWPLWRADIQILYFHYSIQVTRVATYKELDHDFEKHTGILTLVIIFLVGIFLLINCFLYDTKDNTFN